jgi:hypothetical protein
MEINLNPLEFITLKVQQTVADIQNLDNEISGKVQESATAVTAWVQSAPSSIVSAGTIAAQEAFKVSHNIRFENLPRNLQFKFARAGVRDGMRNVLETAKVFESIPAQIRALGPEAVREFCQDKDWSHIQARVNGGGNEAANGIFEYFWVNRARGGKDMTAEVAEIVGAVAKGAIAAAVIELVFSILENSLLCVEGKITQSQLIEQVAADTAKAGIAGGAITGILLALCMIFPPIAGVLGAAAVPLAVAGIGFMGIRAWEIFCHGDRLFGITQQAQKFLGLTEPVIE